MGAAAAGRRGDAEHAAVDDHDRQAVHLVAAVCRGRAGAGVPLRRPQRPPARADRRPDERPRRPREHGRDRQARGHRGGRDRADVLGQPGPHRRVLRRAGRRDRTVRARRSDLSEGPGRARHRRAAARARPAVLHGIAGRTAQPRDDRARGPDVHGGCAARLRHAPHRGRPARQRHVQSRRRDHAPQPRSDRARPRARYRSAEGRVCALHAARAREAAAAGCARRLRRRVLPPPDARRHGHDDAPPARGDAPAGALRCRAGGDRPRPRGVRLADHGHAVLAVRRHPGRDERDGLRALREHPRRRHRLLPRPLRDAGGAARPRRRRPRVVASACGRAARHGTADGRPRDASPAWETRSCCCG